MLHDDAASADAGRDRIVSVLSSLFENCGCCERDVLDDEALYCLGCGTLINRLGPMPTGHEEF